MNKKILIIQHIPREKPGFICCVLKDHGISYDIVDLHNGDTIPDLNGYAAMIVLGGPDSANDASEKITTSMQLVTRWLQMDRPFLGVCLGMQLLVKAVGGEIIKNPVKELGFTDHLGDKHTIHVTNAGLQDPLFKELDKTLHVFQLHGDAAHPPEDVTLLATGPHCKYQAVKVGEHAYGLQCHFELTKEMLELWIAEDNDLNELCEDTLRAEFATYKEHHQKHSRQLFTNFLQLAELL